jgi:hypothetical protein
MEITNDVIVAFRNAFKAFGDTTSWPDEIVEMALNEADAETGSSRWGGFEIDNPQNFKRRGLFYYAAHWLASFYGKSAADPSRVDSAARLNISGKSVGDESTQYRITAMETTGNDWLSTTVYGVQYWRLKKRAGMGALAV